MALPRGNDISISWQIIRFKVHRIARRPIRTLRARWHGIGTEGWWLGWSGKVYMLRIQFIKCCMKGKKALIRFLLGKTGLRVA